MFSIVCNCLNRDARSHRVLDQSWNKYLLSIILSFFFLFTDDAAEFSQVNNALISIFKIDARGIVITCIFLPLFMVTWLAGCKFKFIDKNLNMWYLLYVIFTK